MVAAGVVASPGGASGSQNEENYKDQQRFYIDWVKVDGDWLISRAVVPEEQ